MSPDSIARVEALVTEYEHGSVFSVDLREGKVWVKTPRPPKAGAWHRAQRWISRLIPLYWLRPTVAPGGVEGLAREAERCRRFVEAGLPGCRILHQSPGFLITKHAGETIRETLDRPEIAPGRIRTLLLEMARRLGDVHSAGLCHGRPFLKDVAWDDGQITFLDFEEAPETVMPLEAARVRDALIFLTAMGRLEQVDQTILADAFMAYLDAIPVNCRTNVVRTIRRLRPVFFALGRLPGRWIGRDLRWMKAAGQIGLRAIRIHRRRSVRNG